MKIVWLTCGRIKSNKEIKRLKEIVILILVVMWEVIINVLIVIICSIIIKDQLWDKNIHIPTHNPIRSISIISSSPIIVNRATIHPKISNSKKLTSYKFTKTNLKHQLSQGTFKARVHVDKYFKMTKRKILHNKYRQSLKTYDLIILDFIFIS